MSKRFSKTKPQRQKPKATSVTTTTSPNLDKILNSRGIHFAQRGEFAQAATYFQQAIALNPTEAEFHNNLGIALTEQGKLTEAIACYQQALTLNPNYAQAYYNLGNTFKEQYQFEQAAVAYQQAINLNPNIATMHLNLGNVLQEQNQFAEAIACYQRALALNPINAHIYLNLGIVMRRQGKFIDALDWLQRALAFNKNLTEAHYNLGLVLKERGQLESAVECYQRVITLKPDYPSVHKQLAAVYQQQGQLSKAIEYYQQALVLTPDDLGIHQSLCSTLIEQGNVEEAWQKIQALQTQDQIPVLLLLNYLNELTPATIFSAHQRFNEKYALPLAHLIQPHLNDRQPQRKLKIGYVSADFRTHSVAFFIEPILAHHDHQQFEIVCYYNERHDDFITRRLQSYADHWVNCVELSDAELAAKIRQDQIDILVDLSGHTSGYRLLVFARKPAPVQVTYLGYLSSTGLTSIDYRITDNYVDPPERNQSFNSEQPIRLSGSYFCYHPLINTPHVNSLPALDQGYITFGSFNNYMKMNLKLFTLWAQVLKAVKNSRLLIKAKSFNDLNTQQSFLNLFASLDIESSRLIISNYESSIEIHLRSYHQIDIGLDTYPFHGGTTTCQALWMGVPVVTLVGERHASRTGLSILSAAGLTELIAYTPEEYVEICVKLANDLDYLQQLRARLRTQLQTSPLMDGKQLTHH
ncbi:MAG: tetratricopeptide repeat protein [Thioploca sp.]|nr:tetratricopeptide repeat protein [Thioploca sp.]